MSDNIENFIEDLSKRDFVIFAGAGISTLTGISKWKELLQALNERANVKGIEIDDIDTMHYPEIAQIIYNSLEKDGRVKEYYEIIKESMQPSKCSWHSGHKEIIRASSSIVTTNLDSCFEKAIIDELQEQKSNRKVGYQTLSKLNAKNIMRPYYITYLHGRYDEEKIILKTCDYTKYYQTLNDGEETKLESVLREIFCKQKAIMFVGFSFGDRFVLQTFERYFREMLEKAKNKQETYNLSPKEVKHYALIEDPVKGGERHERWLFDNVSSIQEGTNDWRDLIKVKERVELENRLKEINTEVIRYPHGRHVEIETYFKRIYNKRRSVKDFA